jgi:hypothetical protein
MTKALPYVYVWRRPPSDQFPDGEAFYVGKGRGSRWKGLTSRSRWFVNLRAKYADAATCTRIAVLDDAFACKLEIQLIADFRRLGHALCNLSDGGEGAAPGRPPSERERRIRAQRRESYWRNREAIRARRAAKAAARRAELAPIRAAKRAERAAARIIKRRAEALARYHAKKNPRRPVAGTL